MTECKCPDGWPRKRPMILVPEDWWDGRSIHIPNDPPYPVITGCGWFIIQHTGECEQHDEVMRG